MNALCSEPLVRVVNLCHSYGRGATSLREITFSLPAGAKCALLGANGAGKSTLLLCLAGLVQAEAGEVSVCGVRLPVGKRSARMPLLHDRVGIVFQDPDDQLFGSTVAEDVAYGPRTLGLDGREVARRVTEALAAMGVSHLAHMQPHRLSPGEKRRVAIAGVLATAPRLVILDEPTAFLDPQGVAALESALAALTARGITLLVATHDVDFAAGWATDVLVLKAGRLLRAGCRDLLTDKELLAAAGLRLPYVSQLFTGGDLPPGLTLPLTVEEGRRALRAVAAGHHRQ